jgi:hypothetical protein
MDPVPPESYIVPNPRIPKVLGILNIVFASALMICGLCSIAYYSLIPVFSSAVEKVQKELLEKERADRKLVLEGLDEEEQAAETDEAKAEVREKRKRFEAESPTTKPVPMDFGMKMLEGTGVRRYVWAEFLSGLLLNLLLLTSGIGLVMRRLWGLKLGLGVAALKILRLVLVYGYAAIVVAPLVAQGMAKFQMQQMQNMAQQQVTKPLPPELTVELMTRWLSVWLTSCAVGMIIIGLIYPTVSLWLLSRPGARAACSDLPKATGPSPGQVESW